MHDDTLTLFHAPRTRSSGVLTLLEELGAPYDLHVIDMKKGDHKAPGYLAVNPMGKVPAIVHRGEVVTEQVAIFLYLADVFTDAGLAPGLGDRLRGPYLRWFAFYGACFEPAMIDRALKRDSGTASMSPYGDADTTVAAVRDVLSRGPYMLGERFSALDVLWGGALAWMTQFGLVAADPPIGDYVARLTARPAWARARDKDSALAAARPAESSAEQEAGSDE